VSTEAKKVMIIGGGIAGLTTARELARQNIQVELVEKADFLGGHAIQYACKATDECLQCGACKVEATLKEVVDAPNINIHLATQIQNISKNGRISVQLNKHAADKGDALRACDNGYDAAPATCSAARGYSKHNAKFYTADGQLDPKTAGDADQLNVDAVVLASGFTPFDARIKKNYQYGVLPNVVTGLDLERGKRANGMLLRPSDGQAPQKIAFIQCVGSRDENLGNLWCSQVCCPYALRTAMSLQKKNPDLDITIFYMDIQNTGNNFPTFYQQCRDGLKFVRTIPVDLYQVENDRIQTRFMAETDGTPVKEEFDMVVLSVGIMPGSDNAALAKLLHIELGRDGFAAGADATNTVATDQAGIFLAGTVTGPKTIATTMAHAGQSAGQVIAYLRRAS
jgi:heterodisulfide reductase subunit A2